MSPCSEAQRELRAPVSGGLFWKGKAGGSWHLISGSERTVDSRLSLDVCLSRAVAETGRWNGLVGQKMKRKRSCKRMARSDAGTNRQEGTSTAFRNAVEIIDQGELEAQGLCHAVEGTAAVLFSWRCELSGSTRVVEKRAIWWPSDKVVEATALCHRKRKVRRDRSPHNRHNGARLSCIKPTPVLRAI